MRGATFIPRKVAEINAAYDAFLLAGYPVTLEGTPETLQVARDVDRTNWIIVQRLADKEVAAGNGSGLTFVQTTSNRRYFITYAEQTALVDALTAWGLAAWINWNALKDRARAATSNDDLNAIDVNEGYP